MKSNETIETVHKQRSLCAASLAGNSGVREYVTVQQDSRKSVKDKYATDEADSPERQQFYLTHSLLQTQDIFF